MNRRPQVVLQAFVALVLVLSATIFVGCPSNYTIRNPYLPAAIVKDTGAPYYKGIVSQVKYWDRMATVNTATNFAWWDSTGAAHELNDYYQKIIVLNFFGTWSQASLDQLRELETAHADKDTDVVFMSVTQREKVLGGKAVMALDSFAVQHHIDYQLIVGSRDFGFCYGGIDVVPTTFIITRRRHISDQFEGLVAADALRKAIAKAKTRP